MSDEKKIKYSYSFDEEFFEGSFDSVEDAIAEAFEDHEDNESVMIGEIVDPSDFKCLSAKQLGDHCFDDLQDRLGDEVGEASESFELSDIQKEDLGYAILNWVEANGGFRCFGIKNTKVFENPNKV